MFGASTSDYVRVYCPVFAGINCMFIWRDGQADLGGILHTVFLAADGYLSWY